MPPSLLQHLALPILRDFRREFPDVRIDISSTNVTGLPAQDLDVAVVYDRPTVDDRVTDLLWSVRVTPVCSPELAAREAGKSLEDFLSSNELLHVKLDNQPRDVLWATYARQCALTLDTDRGLAFDTAISAIQYAMSGDGVVLADVDMFAADIAAGRLVAPYDAVFEEGYGYYLKFHAEDLADPVIVLFRHWMIGRFSSQSAARALGGLMARED
jgi:LysR family glycine cleavage system transcriptional activator